MQVEEVIRSALSCVDSVAVHDPRCLKAVQEVYAVVSALRANEIRQLCLEPSILTAEGNLIPSAVLAVTSGARSTTAAATAGGDTPVSNTGGSRSSSVNPPPVAGSRSSSNTATSSATATQHSSSTGTGGGIPPLPPHLQSFAVGALPPLSVKSLILLTARCYSGVAGVTSPSPVVEHVAQVALVVLRLCVTADAILEPSEVQLLGEMALQLGAGRTVQQQQQQQQRTGDPEPSQVRRGSSLSKKGINDSQPTNQQQQQQQQSEKEGNSSDGGLSSVSVLAAIELLLVALYNSHIGGLTADATLGTSARHWLSAWLLRVEDGAAQPIEIFHRLCCFQRIATLRPLPASAVFAGQTMHERLIEFVCGEGGAVHASSVGLALHLLAQLVENGPESMMLSFVTPRLLELHIAGWAASEWTETLEGAFVLLTAVTRLGLAPEQWSSIVRANLHLACAHAIASPSVRVAAASATCLRTMLFLCQRELDIGLSIFFDAQAAPHILRILDNGAENIAAASAKSMQQSHHKQHHQQHLNQSFTATGGEDQQQQQQPDILGLRILSTECALAVAVFSSFSPAHRVALHHVAAKYHFPLALQRAHLALNDADLSIFVNWSLFDEQGRSTNALNDPQLAALLSARPLSAPPPGTTAEEWLDAAFVKLSLIRSLQNATDSDIASVVGMDTHPRPAIGSKELSLALLRHFSGQLQRIAATEGKGGAFPFSEAHHHAHLGGGGGGAGRGGNLNDTSGDALNSSNINEAALAQSQFESCVNLILRFAKCAPLPKREKLMVSRRPPVRGASAGGGDGSWQLPPGSNIGDKVGSSAVATRNIQQGQQQQQVVLLTKKQRPGSSAKPSNAPGKQQYVSSFGTPGTTDVVYQVSSPAADASAAAHYSAPDPQHMRSASDSSAHYHTVNHNNAQRRGSVTGVKSTVSSCSRPHNETGFRRTHLFSHPYVDYYMNAQHRNEYTPNPTIPTQLRRWSLEDVQRGDLFNFFIRLDGLDGLVEEHEREVAAQRQSVLDLHREEMEEGDDDDDENEEQPTEKNDDEFSIDDDGEDQQQQQQQHQPASGGGRSTTVNTNATSTRTPSVVPPPDAVAITTYLGGGTSNSEENIVIENSPLQQRVTALVAEALHGAEMHLLSLNEKAQCCPIKAVHRRAFLLDMVNNVMPAIVSMLSMLFTVSKRAPAAIVRVVRRVERSGIGSSSNSGGAAGNEEQDTTETGPVGTVAIHGGNICAVCHGLEMELLWN